MDCKQQRLLVTQFKKPNEFLAYPQYMDRYKKWIKPLKEFASTINSKKSEATSIVLRHVLQNLRKLKMFDLRIYKDYKGQNFLHFEFLQVLEKVVLLFPKILVQNFLKNDKVDVHLNKCMYQPLCYCGTFAGMCSNKIKYSTRMLLICSGVRTGYHHVATVQHFSTSSYTMATPDSNIFCNMDCAFFRIFGLKRNTNLLISLINSIVSPKDHVRHIQYFSTMRYDKYMSNRDSTLGIEATDIEGKKYNIEIQIIDNFAYPKKPLYYWSGDFSEKLRKTIRIHILGFTYSPETKDYHNTFLMNENGRKMELHTIELEKFHDNDKEGLRDLIQKIKTPLDKWLAFFTAGVLLDRDNLPDELNDEYIKIALNELYYFYFFSGRRTIYKKYLSSLRDGWGTGRTRENLKYIMNYKISSLEELEAEQANEELEQMREDVVILMLDYKVPIKKIEKACHLTRDKIISLKNRKTIHR